MKHSFSLAVLFAFALIGCASAPPAPKNAQGGKIAVKVLIDANWSQVDADNPNHVDQRKQLVAFMKTSAVKELNGSGYEASSIDTVTSYDPKDGSRLLKITVDNYNPGSAAARLLVGMGAGSATLGTRADYTDKGQSLCSVSNSISSGTDWRKIVKKTNILILREMAKHPGN